MGLREFQFFQRMAWGDEWVAVESGMDRGRAFQSLLHIGLHFPAGFPFVTPL
jgi:hypothetical protein